MPSNRCQCNVQSKFTKKLRLCLNNKKIMNYCHIHAEIHYAKYAIKIQSVFIGYYIRKKLKIYYKLPTDIQRKIIWHMNEEIYVKHFHSSVSNLICHKLDNFILKYDSIILTVFNYTFQTSDFSSEFFHELNNVINLLKKYTSIIYYINIKHNIHMIKLFIIKLTTLLYDYPFPDNWKWILNLDYKLLI